MNCGWAKVDAIKDERGVLHIPLIPFEAKHQFCVTQLNGQVRGGHAHKRASQVIWCAQGSMTATIQRGAVVNIVDLVPEYSIQVAPKSWVTLLKFSPDCVYFVWSDHEYDEDEYIRDPLEFSKTAGALPRPVGLVNGEVYLGDPNWPG